MYNWEKISKLEPSNGNRKIVAFDQVVKCYNDRFRFGLKHSFRRILSKIFSSTTRAERDKERGERVKGGEEGEGGKGGEGGEGKEGREGGERGEGKMKKRRGM